MILCAFHVFHIHLEMHSLFWIALWLFSNGLKIKGELQCRSRDNCFWQERREIRFQRTAGREEKIRN